MAQKADSVPGDIILIVEVGEDGSPADGTFLSGDFRVIPLAQRIGCCTENSKLVRLLCVYDMNHVHLSIPYNTIQHNSRDSLTAYVFSDRNP